MITKKEAEKLFLYCLEELRLLIENPYQNYALIERLSTVKNNLQILYEQLFLKREVNTKKPIQIGDSNIYSVLEVSQKLEVTPVTIWKYLKQGKIKGQKVMGRWFISEENLTNFFKDSN
jgi:hypothetical protein